MTTWITICDTCKRDGWDAASGGPTDGEVLAGLIEARTNGALRTRRISCLMGCSHGCNVAIQGTGKMNYTLGRFEPTGEAAQGVVDYARLHAESETGVVAFRQWPQAIKGHFISRHPPLPETE